MEISYSIQVVLQQETKSCSLSSISFLELLKNLRECFYEFDEKIIQYIDDEGDLVVFSTTEELELALKLTPNNLRIVLQKKSIPEVPIPVRWIPKDKRPKKDHTKMIFPIFNGRSKIFTSTKYNETKNFAVPEIHLTLQPYLSPNPGLLNSN